jgi:hypothetical protein
MTISLDELRNPRWVKIQNRYPMSYEKQDRFNEIYPQEHNERFLGSEGREGGWKFPGYNPNHQSTKTEKFNLRSDNVVIKPY